MKKTDDVKKLVKILIGSAWADGKLQPEEQQYLHQIALEKGLATDPEIQPLLNEFTAVPPTQCYEWVREYLGNHPSVEDYHKVLEAISGLIYSDGEVAIEEAKLLTKLQSLYPEGRSPQPGYSTLLKEIQKLYRRWVDLKT
ncbi:MAG: TerB family tellurite resistance protein [Chroococcidiopsidaceae cyanobacterium CP_BM_ER_R8_30]|nr:TerB family tellurite resistance protein [Chroococcidiopsidaceae cyanobacterium CP_BM_ER_R8_30]